MTLTPVPFKEWIEQVRPTLSPPVCNKLLYGGQLKVMVVTGPNQRKDFHIEEGEEIFYQLQGDMRLDVMEGGKLKEIPIKEGEIFTLPARIPHSPQRFANTMGLVIERERLPDETDGLRWYTEANGVLYEEWFHCEDLGVQLVPVIKRFFASDAYKSGVPSQEIGAPQVAIDDKKVLPQPTDLKAFLNTSDSLQPLQFVEGEFQTVLVHGASANPYATYTSFSSEVFVYQLTGSSTVRVQDVTDGPVALKEQDVVLIPPHSKVLLETSGNAVTMFVSNKSL